MKVFKYKVNIKSNNYINLIYILLKIKLKNPKLIFNFNLGKYSQVKNHRKN
jgi:hypothetical protein